MLLKPAPTNKKNRDIYVAAEQNYTIVNSYTYTTIFAVWDNRIIIYIYMLIADRHGSRMGVLWPNT